MAMFGFCSLNSEGESASYSRISVAVSLEIAGFSEERAMKTFNCNLTKIENFSCNQNPGTSLMLL